MAICEKCGREIPEGSICECENEICDALTPADDNDLAENTAETVISLAKESVGTEESAVTDDSVSEAATEETVSETSAASEETQADTAEPEIKEEKTETAEETKAEEAPAPEVKAEPVKSAEPEVKKETVKTETAKQTAVAASDESGTPAQKNGSANKNLKVIIPVAAALAAVIGITGYVSANAYKKPVNQFAKAYNSNNVDKVIECMLPKDSVKEMKDKLKDQDSSWKEFVKEGKDILKEAKEDKYGKNAKMEITFINKYKAKKDEINKNKAFYSFAKTDEEIDKAYRVKLSANIEGKDDSDSAKHEVYVVHFEKSGWKISPYMNDIDSSLSLNKILY